MTVNDLFIWFGNLRIDQILGAIAIYLIAVALPVTIWHLRNY